VAAGELELAYLAVRLCELVAQLGVLGAQALVLLKRAAQPGPERLLACALMPGQPRRGALVLLAELLDRGAQLSVAVEERAADASLDGDRLETDRGSASRELCQRATGSLHDHKRTGGDEIYDELIAHSLEVANEARELARRGIEHKDQSERPAREVRRESRAELLGVERTFLIVRCNRASEAVVPLSRNWRPRTSRSSVATSIP
jgi:hypothetical protein